jgi:hypothetical protein
MYPDKIRCTTNQKYSIGKFHYQGSMSSGNCRAEGALANSGIEVLTG